MFLLELKKGSLIWQAPSLYHIDEVLCQTAVLLCAFYGFTSALNNAYGHFSTQNLQLLQVTAVYYMCQAVVFEVNIGLKRHSNDQNLENALVDSKTFCQVILLFSLPWGCLCASKSTAKVTWFWTCKYTIMNCYQYSVENLDLLLSLIFQKWRVLNPVRVFCVGETLFVVNVFSEMATCAIFLRHFAMATL